MFLNNLRRTKTPTIQREQIVTWLLVGSGTALGTTASVYPPISDIVFNTVSTAETISVSAILGNGQTITPTIYSVSTNLPVTATALASGAYYIRYQQLGNIYSLTFTKSGALNPASVSGVAVKQSYNTKG